MMTSIQLCEGQHSSRVYSDIDWHSNNKESEIYFAQRSHGDVRYLLDNAINRLKPRTIQLNHYVIYVVPYVMHCIAFPTPGKGIFWLTAMETNQALRSHPCRPIKLIVTKRLLFPCGRAKSKISRPLLPSCNEINANRPLFVLKK